MRLTLMVADVVSLVALVAGLSGGSLAGQVAGRQSFAIEGQVVLPGGLKITEFGNEIRVTVVESESGSVVASVGVDGQGRYVVDALEDGVYSIEVQGGGFVGARYAPISYRFPAALRFDLSLRLEPVDSEGLTANIPTSGMILGKLRSKDGGRVESARICAVAAATEWCTTPNRLGQYRLTVPAGDHQLRVTVDGRIRWTSPIQVRAGAVLRDVARIE